MKKICSGCKDELNLDLFNFKNKSKGLRHSYCKECGKLKTRKHYSNNKDYYVEKARRNNVTWKQSRQEKLYEYLLEHPCVDCKETDPLVLEFDHRGEKIECVSLLFNQSRSWNTIEKEIAKCDVRCANCHKRKTAKDLNSWKYQKSLVV